jgi:hypothetical protein
MITGDTLKRLQDALKGRTLSGTAAYEINKLLCEGLPYKNFCDQGDKLAGRFKNDLQAIVDNAIAAGVVPAKSLLTAHQKAAIKKRRTA